MTIDRTEYYIDVSVIHPTEADKNKPAGHCAKKRENEKRVHYAPALQLKGNEKIVIVPFVLESYGAWGTDAIKFLRTAFDSALMAPPEDLMSLSIAITQISMALQDGNALLMERTMGAQLSADLAASLTQAV